MYEGAKSVSSTNTGPSFFKPRSNSKEALKMINYIINDKTFKIKNEEKLIESFYKLVTQKLSGEILKILEENFPELIKKYKGTK